MNAQTATLLKRAAGALALIEVSRREVAKPPHERMPPARRMEVLRATTERTTKALMADWKATSHRERAKKRRYYSQALFEAKAALKKAKPE